MTKVSCSARHCIYNNCDLCSAAMIRVEGEDAKHSKGTFCNTFSNNDFDGTVEGLLNTNYVGELRQIFNGNNDIVMNPVIECKAKECIHNKEEKCMAKDIFVNGPSATYKMSTECETFINK